MKVSGSKQIMTMQMGQIKTNTNLFICNGSTVRMCDLLLALLEFIMLLSKIPIIKSSSTTTAIFIRCSSLVHMYYIQAEGKVEILS